MRTGLPYRELEVQLFYLTESNMYIHGLSLPNMRTRYIQFHSILKVTGTGYPTKFSEAKGFTLLKV